MHSVYEGLSSGIMQERRVAFSIILLSLCLSTKGTVTKMGQTISVFPCFNIAVNQLISNVSQIK